jgi:hypothetical protein
VFVAPSHLIQSISRPFDLECISTSLDTHINRDPLIFFLSPLFRFPRCFGFFVRASVVATSAVSAACLDVGCEDVLEQHGYLHPRILWLLLEWFRALPG